MVSDKNKRFFEKITEKQSWKIQTLVNQSQKFDDEKLYSMIENLTFIPSIHSLSKQEASFIIDILQGCKEQSRPFPPRTAEKIKNHTNSLPSIGQIYFIRESVRSLGWDAGCFKEWLKKITGASNLNELTMGSAQKAYIGFVAIRKHYLRTERI